MAGPMQGHVLERPEPTTVDVTDADFEQSVIEESKRRPVVVDLWADWCQPCKTLGPILERTAEKHAGAFLLAKLDVDANPMVAGALGVQSIPTVVAFKDGQPVDGFVGSYPEPEVERFVAGLVPSETEVAAEQAVAQAEAGDVVVAEAELREVLARDADNEQARLGLGALLAERGDLDDARELVTPLLPSAEAERILSKVRVGEWAAIDPAATGVDAAKVRAVKGQIREALDDLLELAPTDDEARTAMLDLFNALDEDDPLVSEYRRKLSSVLF
ncbi:MAG: tetratricopeptide repeat protein [Actinomycetota bacterium]